LGLLRGWTGTTAATGAASAARAPRSPSRRFLRADRSTQTPARDRDRLRTDASGAPQSHAQELPALQDTGSRVSIRSVGLEGRQLSARRHGYLQRLA
jgi:hypothetical protein